MEGKFGITRRGLLKGAAVLGASAVLSGSIDTTVALAASGDSSTETETMVASGSSGTQGAATDAEAQYGFMVRVRNCVNCGKCVEVCRKHNGTPVGIEARRKVTPYQKRNGKELYISTSCMHCEHPACAMVCPAGAISKGAGGIVTVNQDRCIGCKYCYQACPFGVPHYTTAGMDKCDCCLGAGIELGQTPWCVSSCRFGALEYGVLSDLQAETNGKAVQLEGDTGPSLLLR